MNIITSALQNTLKTLFETHGNIELIVAYSGGIDSQVLLHALVQLKQNKIINNEITVCHVNHGLSGNAERWQKLAEQECIKLSVNLIVKRVNVRSKAQQSLEALARDARYNALKSLREKKSVVLTGHHSDDQSETFLLALKRGAGLKGLSAMSVQTQLDQHLLVRPLLNVARQEIENYAENHQLSWVEDESNLDTCFDRNFIRQKIIPLLRERWPSINNTINRSASHCLAGQELLDELAEQDLTVCKTGDSGLHVSALTTLSPARFNNLIRFFMAQQGCLMPSTEQVNQVRLQLQADEDKSPQIKVAEQVFRRFKNTLFLTPEYSDISNWQGQVDLFQDTLMFGNNVLVLPDNLGELSFNTNVVINTDSRTNLPRISLPMLGQQVSVRFCHENPKCLPHFRQHSRTVKKVLQELNIAPWQRKRIAFLYYDNELVAAIGHFICQPFIESDPKLGMQIDHAKLTS
ncbi:tRNA lysidine(34) synthetase TilS [Colwellia psychrerythraea]|uniref:tRNA(Ile)-lysidine synthase n=1 Tax=Colwellia psychrerythraea (strain 34H / ATCC BAA-681) TaxID=167879 RepID=Q485F1_COLP3|nr:tRNA lysidine(34) synthetase TilS [Colwellia psychrerythraea]AAZ28202.1 tRNA(Ile)-lysidine synthetase [Colwellia psychrerythraea 34H]